MRKKKVTFLFITLAVLMVLMTGCSIKDLFQKKIINEIENRYVEYNNTITVNNIEDALVIASEKGQSCSVGVRMASNGIFTSTVDTGSGVVVKRLEEGTTGYRYYVVTNRHVIYSKNGAKEIKVYLGANRGYVDAKLIAYDKQVDLALLSFSSPFLLNVATLNTEEPKVGTFAIAVGSPYNLEAYYNTVTIGSISASTRYYIEEDINGKDVTNKYIQHCAPINSGNSGGGLFNIYGELVGINTWKVVGELSDNVEGLCFAIPSQFIVEKFSTYLNE